MADPLERIANALEKLASDPEIEIEAGPPICPSCGKFDPEVILPDQEGARGLMSHLVTQAVCASCSQMLFIIIESYSVHKSSVTAKNEIEERERAGFFNGKVQRLQGTEDREVPTGAGSVLSGDSAE